ncbi:MAG: hypothetical protein N4J56_006988 [Chroococcidiopsis sp. SAG 2025]|uniref:DUF928 domain-containing protein n=1 Tax=Chroococcidiopsis sp. SAG 2025 TaxID=171389 RepID=UPI000D080BE2|nr:DUF928 domain-containing protein [Chroococcidiopsis sp. SAG 2025]MDV2997283.1 hypothetical protein [Chroococcidiopsis sp. SAG 2025]PSB49148.1 hypothetical protein C7B80_02820 [Cyanosarcina cf. burmensis CCALA 770]
MLKKLPQLPIAIAIAITWIFVGYSNYPWQVWAQSDRAIDNVSTSKRAKQQPDFSGYGRPGRRTGGGSRSPCSPIDPPLTALIPETNWGNTVAERPSFWFYVPYSPQQAQSGEFVLQTERGEDVYRVPITLPQTPGVVSLSIPSTEKPLEIDRWYRWYFKLYCTQQVSAPIFVEGWVRRVALTPTLKNQLLSAKARDYNVYAANGIWYDAIAYLAQLRLNSASAQLDYEWADLLNAKGVGLEQLQQQPIVGNAVLVSEVKSQKLKVKSQK